MTDKQPSAEELMKQIESFENTVKGLNENIAKLKTKLKENLEKYGSDTAKWPKTS